MNTQRCIAFERLLSFRDVGGCRGEGGRPVRRGPLYRSDSLGRLRGKALRQGSGAAVAQPRHRAPAPRPGRAGAGGGDRLADEIVADASLDDTFVRRGEEYALRVGRLHVVAEYARHIGHADPVRERIDGVTGADARGGTALRCGRARGGCAPRRARNGATARCRTP
ncbi:DUF664 domain-containing protein [Streptomyces sp. NPDC057499]|uniref:mycothiol transferase n=1 Tax=Streptomyces sp. NPDC057499 TaxID=3346150 RepID=UPI0036B12ED9